MRATSLRNVLVAASLLVVIGLSLGGCSRPQPSSKQAPVSRSAISSAAAAYATVPTASVPATASALASTTAMGSQPATRTRPPANLPAPIAQLTKPSAITTIDGPRDMPVPMLMYHVVGDVPQGAGFPDLYVKPSDFIAQMNYLSRHGYHAVTMQQVYDFWQGKGSLPDKPVVITFDDGFTTDYTLVAPLLKTVDWPATLFLIVGRHKPRMPHRQVQAMIDSGWELGSHTITHEELPSLSARDMHKDIAGSRKLLRKEYHVPVNFFCYPSGKFNAQAEAEVQRAGYLLATTTVSGLARPSEPYTLRRVRVLGGMGVNSFAAALTNAR